MKRNTGKAFLSIGIVFLIAGFIQQGFTLSFKSGLFSLGFIFSLSGLVTILMENKSNKDTE